MLANIFVAAMAALPLVAGIASNCARSYTVVDGDTCDAISAAHNVSTYQLTAVNNADTVVINDGCSNLAIGQVLCLGLTGSDCSQTVIVVPGNTCNDITGAAGINATILYANNPQINSDCSNIYTGEVLCAAKEVCVPPAPANRPTSSVVVAPGTATAQPAPTQTPATATATGDDGDEGDEGDDGDDDDLPWCEDPNDDGEW